MGLTCSNTSKLIRSVEEKKLIARIIGKVDKRQMHFSLTAEGKEQITAIKSTTHEMPELLQQIVGLLSIGFLLSGGTKGNPLMLAISMKAVSSFSEMP